jgi:hypothetical protein
MDPTATTDDYQSGALFGSTPNTSTLTANMLNPAASGPNDYTTILTNGIASATANMIGGRINNAAENTALAGSLSTPASTGPSMTMILIIGAAIFFLVK